MIWDNDAQQPSTALADACAIDLPQPAAIGPHQTSPTKAARCPAALLDKELNNTMSSTRQYGGGLRLANLLVLASVFLFATSASASAANLHVEIFGPGSGQVVSHEELPTTPPIECAGPPTAGTCEGALFLPPEGGEAAAVVAIPDPGSEIGEWTATSTGFGIKPAGCATGNEQCRWVEFAGGEVTMTVAFVEAAGPTEFPLTVTTNTGTGAGTVECEVDGGGLAACPAEVEDGAEVKVVATPDGSSTLDAVSGTGSAAACAASPCEFTITEDSSVTAEFNLIPIVEHELTINETGTGAGTVECEVDGGGLAACPAEVEDGAEVKVVATPDGSSTLDAVSGTGSAAACAASPCEFTITEDSSVTAEFNEIANPSILSVFKGGNGEGTVTGPGINCGTEPCQETYEEGEEITLEASPEGGSAFAGWLGCHPEAGEITKCTVTLNGPMVDVTAVFMAEGPQGPPGEDGAPGAPGEDGADGQDGSNGQDGSDGSNGSNGSNGAQGVPGVPGLPGPQGPRGPAGPAGKIVCKARQKGKRIVVRCRVKANNRAGKRANRSQRVRWALMQGGHAVKHGKTGVRRLNRVVNHLPAGRYVLRVKGQGGTRIVIH
ncbi:MAG TPA: hypothetical protein VFT19_05335 [Solirubrobacterales bacterium]|nr:hypothetical protein [Solirubrobacterales bacterium]